jgi:hypothetical protein
MGRTAHKALGQRTIPSSSGSTVTGKTDFAIASARAGIRGGTKARFCGVVDLINFVPTARR